MSFVEALKGLNNTLGFQVTEKPDEAPSLIRRGQLPDRKDMELSTVIAPQDSPQILFQVHLHVRIPPERGDIQDAVSTLVELMHANSAFASMPGMWGCGHLGSRESVLVFQHDWYATWGLMDIMSADDVRQFCLEMSDTMEVCVTTAAQVICAAIDSGRALSREEIEKKLEQAALLLEEHGET